MVVLILLSGPMTARAEAWPDIPLTLLEGTETNLTAFAGQAVLLVNTASLCGYTPQYEGLQALHDRFHDLGFTVLAVPSNSFQQELGSDTEVAAFCDVQFGLTFPMTQITDVRGRSAHPLYQWLRSEGVRPRWNFHKALIGPTGEVIAQWPSHIPPEHPALLRAIESALPSTHRF